METMLGEDGQPLRLRGYAAIWGSESGGLRMGRRPFVFRGNVRLTIGHADHVALADRRSGSLRCWQDATGLAWEADVTADWVGHWMLRYIAQGESRCSYLGRESVRTLDDGMEEIHGVELMDVSLTAAPHFAETGAWRSDAYWRDLPTDVRRLRDAWHKGKREPLPDLLVRSKPASRPVRAVAYALVRRPDLDPADDIWAGLPRDLLKALRELSAAERLAAPYIERAQTRVAR